MNKTMKFSQDVWFCAFLLNQNIAIVKYEVIGAGRVKCYFDLDDAAWQQLKLSFNNNEISKYKNLIQQIKDLAW